MDKVKIEFLVAMLRARYATNHTALARFNHLYNSEDPPSYDTELAESDGMVQGQQQVIKYMIDCLEGKAATLSGEGLSHIQEAIRKAEQA